MCKEGRCMCACECVGGEGSQCMLGEEGREGGVVWGGREGSV